MSQNEKSYHDGKYYFERVLIVFFCLLEACCFGGAFYTCTNTEPLFLGIHIACGAICVLGFLFALVKTFHALTARH